MGRCSITDKKNHEKDMMVSRHLKSQDIKSEPRKEDLTNVRRNDQRAKKIFKQGHCPRS